jgi:hypothetical protein
MMDEGEDFGLGIEVCSKHGFSSTKSNPIRSNTAERAQRIKIF